jgi:hypothetical protein
LTAVNFLTLRALEQRESNSRQPAAARNLVAAGINMTAAVSFRRAR